ncbi:MAG: Isoleucine-tRNA ligase [candidate division WWE3 bacterium GW2011_GWA1_41_8]|uniref:Isoleucine--tRNA ligase n=1 Tax=candidate division WWE3 bacterium GW2011_GWA1_41_8 TaxID=1619103 RepID=A0A0G0X7B0_UNCKA|nr:MAG: Isoleucine-tRNA ligase [candidate division WWE3 bacterium GW2011_GWA1_41_8]
MTEEMKNKFKELEPVLELPKLESGVLKYWNEIDILNYTYKQREGSEEKVYYDGPITANGLPHYGHAITWTMKDIIPRFWTMQGYYVARNMGWDCQGIPVEYEVEKKLGFKNKHEVEEYGIEKFNDQCKESVLKYRTAMIEYEQRLGRLIDHNSEYATMEPKYIESMWWALKELYNKGLLYEGHKVVAYSTRSGMTLSTHEVAEGGYGEIVDPAVTVKFRLIGEENTFILAWTTTPWTLPGNLLLAVRNDISYVKVELNNEFLILAEETIENVLGDEKYEIIGKFKGSDLVGRTYVPLFDNFVDKKEQGAFVVVHGNHVNTEEGTGIVHLAPYGMEDFDILMDLSITLFDYLDEEGTFNSSVPELEGLFYKKANIKIVELLAEKGLMFKHEDYPHQMPLDYRTKTPLIYKPIKSWYVNVEKIKGKLLEETGKVKFVPESEGKRFRAWIEKARDWSLSRKRFWGTPLPLWINDKTAEIKFAGSFAELSELSGKDLGNEFDPHKPYVDEITWEDPNGGTYRRVPEVIDVWFDSGAMPFAQHHYPFENKELFEKRYPADYISEGDDQIRLWFYTMFVLGVSLFDKTPYKNVVVIGMLGDENGKKMSKSKGNYPPIEEVFNDYGSDMLRYFLLISPIVRGEAARFSYDLLTETKKEYFTMLWNSYKYFITYANANNYQPSLGMPESDNLLDQWILARLKQTSRVMSENFDKYYVMDAARQLRPFVSDLSTWYIRRSRDRISEGDKQALDVLYYVLIEFAKLSAPVTPLLSEALYEHLNVRELSGLKSVHVEKLTEYGELSKDEITLIKQMEFTRQIVSLTLAIRSAEGIKVRQPLQTLYIRSQSKIFAEKDLMVEIIRDEVNVKDIVLGEPTGEIPFMEDANFKVWLNMDISKELQIQGVAREMVRT